MRDACAAKGKVPGPLGVRIWAGAPRGQKRRRCGLLLEPLHRSQGTTHPDAQRVLHPGSRLRDPKHTARTALHAQHGASIVVGCTAWNNGANFCRHLVDLLTGHETQQVVRRGCRYHPSPRTARRADHPSRQRGQDRPWPARLARTPPAPNGHRQAGRRPPSRVPGAPWVAGVVLWVRQKTRPVSTTRACSACACSRVLVMGLSQITSKPAASAAIASGKWLSLGVMMATTSGRSLRAASPAMSGSATGVTALRRQPQAHASVERLCRVARQGCGYDVIASIQARGLAVHCANE